MQAYEEEELLRLVYYGGVEPSLRKEVWPFLLGHYHFTMSLTERKEVSPRHRLIRKSRRKQEERNPAVLHRWTSRFERVTSRP